MKRIKQTAAIPGSQPSVQLTEEQADHLFDEVSHFQEVYKKKPHPLQAEAIAFNIWDYDDDENILSTIESNLDIINDLVKDLSAPSVFGHRREVCNIQKLLKQTQLFLQLVKLPALDH